VAGGWFSGAAQEEAGSSSSSSRLPLPGRHIIARGTPTTTRPAHAQGLLHGEKDRNGNIDPHPQVHLQQQQGHRRTRGGGGSAGVLPLSIY